MRAPFIKKGWLPSTLFGPPSQRGDTPIPPPTCGGSDVIHRPYIGPTVAFGLSNHTTAMIQPEPRRRLLRIIESRRKILREAIREIVQEYKRAERRQRWRDAIWDIIQQKRAKKDRLKRMVSKMAEQRRAQKAAELCARIRERQEDRRCVVCLSYHAPSELHMQRLFKTHAVHAKLNFPRKVLNTTIRMWCCQARVHMACILQSMHSLYGRANKHLWRCVHCRRYLMNSREEDVFHIGINDIDSFDSDDNEEIEHVHRIHDLPLEQSIRDEGQ